MLMANAKKIIRIVGIILLVIGVIWVIFSGFGTYTVASFWGEAPGGIFLMFVGVVIIVIGLCLLATSFGLQEKQAKPITE